MNRPVSEIMSRDPVVLEEWENLLDVAQDLSRYHIRHLPVVDDGRLVGLVSHRDLLKFTATALDQGIARDERDRRLKEQTFVREVMSQDIETVTPDTTIADAVQRLVDTRLGCLPVVGDGGKLVGIVSEHDFLKLLAKMLKRPD